MSSPQIRIIGPRDQHRLVGDFTVVDTTSRSTSVWTTELSPFHLGPCPLYGGQVARRMENAWQFAKCYRQHVDADGNPSAAYWHWARQGWANSMAVRYPMGKGAKPEYLYWDGERLGYVAGRHRVYWPLYRDAVARTSAFARLKEIVAAGKPLALFDFDGYDHDAAKVPLASVIQDDRRPMGHAFVLKAMLIHGPDVTPKDVIAGAAAAAPAEVAAPLAAPQLGLFDAEPVAALSRMRA